MKFPMGQYPVKQKAMLAMQTAFRRLRPKRIKKILKEYFDKSSDRANYIATLLIVGEMLMEDSDVTCEPIYESHMELEKLYGSDLADKIVYYRDKCKEDLILKEYMLCLLATDGKLRNMVLPYEMMPDDMELDEGLVYDIYYHPKRESDYYKESKAKTFFIENVLGHIL